MPKQVINKVRAERVFKKRDYALFILLSVLSLSATGCFIAYWLSFKSWFYHPFRFALTLAMFLVIILNYFGRWFLLPYMRKPRPMNARRGWRVAVVTTVIPGAEPLDMLKRTLSAMVGMDYPHDTWLLDEEDDDEVKALCQALGVYHFSRKHLPRYQTETGRFQSHSKHGNYNAWFCEIGFDRYQIISTFDPDHVPTRHFLSKVLGYFNDPAVGYVQAAQVYYNQKASLIARGAAEETYGYYSSVQMASYGLGYPIIIGCHNTHRVSALRMIGGFASHDAEDLLNTLLYQSSGWRGVYIPEIIARGLAPVDWNGYLTQQRRWARSVLDIKLRIYHKHSDNLSSQTRLMSFLHGFNYLYKSFIILLGLLLTLYMLATGDNPSLISFAGLPKLAGLCLVLVLCDFYRQRFYLQPRTEWGLHWRAVLLQFAKWPYMLLALYEVLSNRRIPYALTPKVKAKSRRLMLAGPHLTVCVLVLSFWLFGIGGNHITEPLIHGWAALTAAASFILALMEFKQFPDPYDEELATSANESKAAEKLEYC